MGVENNENVGVWNYMESSGCSATNSGTFAKDNQQNCNFFNGRGYATSKGIRNYDPRYLSLSFEFKTFDYNALLFLLHGNDSVSYGTFSYYVPYKLYGYFFRVSI